VGVAALGLREVTTPALPEEGWGDWVLTSLGAALDGTMLQAVRFVVDATLMPRPEDLAALRESAAPFVAGELWHHPRSFFDFIDDPVMPTEVRGRHRRNLGGGGTLIGREFATAYRPHPLLAKASEAMHTHQDRLLVEHWMHGPERPRGTVVALHGFTMGYPRMDAFALFAASLFAAGFDVALVTLPFHGARTPTQARFSGEHFAIPDVARFNEAVRQAVYELRVLIGWLRDFIDAPLGLLGLSLGGYLAALMAGLNDDLDFVVPMVPPVCIGDLAWRFFTQSRKHPQGATAAFSREELRASYRVHSPLTYPLQIDKRRVLIVAGRGDQIVPAQHPHTLWQHWGEPAIHWFSGSHLAPFRRGGVFARIRAHVERCV
jgi:pimeloyl-ACP methyl ester carboxylesterase